MAENIYSINQEHRLHQVLHLSLDLIRDLSIYPALLLSTLRLLSLHILSYIKEEILRLTSMIALMDSLSNSFDDDILSLILISSTLDLLIYRYTKDMSCLNQPLICILKWWRKILKLSRYVCMIVWTCLERFTMRSVHIKVLVYI